MAIQTVVEAARNAGFSGDDLVTAVAIALAESSGKRRATNTNDNGSTDYGLWQINSVHEASGFNPNKAFDPDYNAEWAHRLYEESGFSPWVAYDTGAYKKFMDDARAALNGQSNSGGGGGGGGGQQADNLVEEDHSDLLMNILQTIASGSRGSTDPSLTQEQRAVRQATGGFGGQTAEADAAAVGMDTDMNRAGDTDTGTRARSDPNWAPGQWGGFSNGKIPLGEMTAVKGVHYSGNATHYFEPTAAKQFRKMVRDAKRDGVTITLTDSYRSYAAQERARAEKGDMAATPGTSNHGWGKAIDVASGREWIQRNGAKYGWVWPEWAQPGGSNPEDWHFEFGAEA